jgi:hypothetical protein
MTRTSGEGPFLIKRPFWKAAAAVALAPAAAFSFANTHATGARHLVTQVPVRAMTVDAAPPRVATQGLVTEPVAAATAVSDELPLHSAYTAARLQHARALIAAERAAERRAAERRAAQRRAAQRRAAQRAAARARAAAAHARVELAARAQPKAVAAPAAAAAAAPAAAGSWQQIVASLAGSGAGCLDNIIERESGGDVSATNPDGAYGIPQALPGSKMASAGADWQTNPETQIRWMIGYTNQTYGSPCAAWAHEQAAGSY